MKTKTMAEEFRDWLDDPKTQRMIVKEIAKLEPYQLQYLGPYLNPPGRIKLSKKMSKYKKPKVQP